MKYLLFFILFFAINNCSSNNTVYWCGDHACINKKERESYFKETMIVEIKSIDNTKNKNISETEKIIEQANLKEGTKVKDKKSLLRREKLKIKSLKKQTRLEKKRKIKEQKKMAKLKKLEEKRIKKERKIAKKKISPDKKKLLINKPDLKADTKNIKMKSDKFEEIVKQINKKNILKPYPDINDIPN